MSRHAITPGIGADRGDGLAGLARAAQAPTHDPERIGDLATAEALDAMARPGCPICAVMAAHERRYIEAFWPAARTDPHVRERFWDAGGFCGRHARLFERRLAARQGGPAIADLYGRLVERDLSAIEERLRSLDRPRRRARALRWPERRRRCPACEDHDLALERKAAFLVLALHDHRARRRYAISDGPCLPHLATLIDQALAEDRGTARFLIEDQRDRLERLGRGLSEYRRKLDARFAGEPRGAEQGSWTDAIRRYAGDEPAGS